jgi:hypothetical protein
MLNAEDRQATLSDVLPGAAESHAVTLHIGGRA